MKSLIVTIVALALAAACGGNTAATPSTPPGPATEYRNTLSGLNAAAQLDLIQNVIYFAPGAASVVHIHTSPNLATVLKGQITVKVPAGDKQAAAGEMLVEPINQALQAYNTGSSDAMVVVAFAVPHGAKPTTPVAGKAAPATLNKTMYTVTLVSPGVSGGYTLVQQVLDFAPGAQTPRVRVGGPGVITVLEGQLTLNSDITRTYKAGDSFAEMPGQTVQAINAGSAHLVLAETFALPDGAPLTTNV